MKIRYKLTLGILIVGLLVGVLGVAVTIKLQFDSVEATAKREAETVATMLVHLIHHEMLEHGEVTLAANQAELQNFVEALYTLHRRDVVIVDTDKKIIADAIPQNVGTRFHYDPGNQVAQTIKDGVARTFVATSADFPQGIKQVVVPLTTADGKTIGAVIFDYTALYADLATSARTTAELSALVAVLCTLLAVGFGYIIARSISNPLGALMEGAARIAAGDLNVRVQVQSNDEIGDLAASFNRMTEELKGSYARLQAELGARKRAEERLAKLNECLLSFGASPNENINRLVAFCGEQLGAACALYNRLEDHQLRALGQWHTPPDFNPVDKPNGHICYAVIQSGREDAWVIRDLLHTAYAQTDPNVLRHGLKTYIGKAVSFEGAFVGSLCVIYQEDRIPSEDDLNLLGIAASAVGVEEKRKHAEAELQTYARQQAALFKISADLAAALDETDICQKVVRGVHETLGYAHTYLFLVDEATGERVLPEGASIGWRDAPTRWRIPPGQGLSEYALLSGQLHYTPDVTRDPRYVPGIGTGAEVDVPIRIGDPSSLRHGEPRSESNRQGGLFDYRSGGSGRVVGVLIVESEQSHAFGQHDFAVLTAAANQTSLALLRAREHQAVKEAEAHYHDLFNTVPVGIFQTTLDGRYALANPALARIYGYASPEELIANVSDLNRRFYVQPDRRVEFARRMEEHDAVQEFEPEVRCKDGSVIWVSENARAIRDASGRLIGFEGTTVDITARKQAEKQIKAALKEKETLLREIHHRVKNNLQVVSSLLNLQASSQPDQQVCALFQESQSRLQAMALVHEMLYRSADLAHIRLAGYLRDLTAGLFQTYNVNADAIRLNLAVEDIALDIETAIPCGLIVNELVSNALRHAFPNGQRGQVWLTLSASHAELCLTVGDDGVGLPPGLDFRQAPSLGLKLVNALVEQLRGRLELGTDGKTEFRITFPI